MRRDKFGSPSEKPVKDANANENQILLFNEIEAEADSTVPEPFKENASGITARGKRVRKGQIIGELPVEEVVCAASPKYLVCANCAGKLKPVGKEYVRQELQYIPSQLKVIKYYRQSYECPKCKHTDNPYFIKAVALTSLMNHSLASPSSVAYVMYQK